ncbi:MAG: aminotransferase class I/II-fold pyridoxal phosphate-dependent enzyme [Ignavibacteriales bacterium]|nr:aminotransferase class I/II-fold pyridoxal phosphate-dependent enzyme [Ignavibacteriales bacterium]
MSADEFIDLRSDTVTKPSRGMRHAMASAEVGDDVFGEDPTVNRLQERVAELLGKEAALFVPSGVMANQLAVKILTQPGDEIIVEEGSHIFNYETAAPALISNVQIRTLQGTRGVLSVDQIGSAVRSKDYHQPRTSLVCLENTHNRAGGTIYPLQEIDRIRAFTTSRGISMHLDGARIWNAWIATGTHPKEFAKYFDTVSVCFSKGLGAPVGSAVAGTKEAIEKARRFRKVLGGGMRQAGVLAAAALYAMENNIERLSEDHEKAQLFAESVSRVPGLDIDLPSVQTNIVIIDIVKTGKSTGEILSLLKAKKVLLTEMTNTKIRAVMHLDAPKEKVESAAQTVIGSL